MLYVTHLLNGLFMVALPVALGVFLARRFGLGWRLLGVGAATFILSQVLHIPFNMVVFREVAPPPPGSWQSVSLAAALGLSAGVFEEGARYLAYRYWIKDARSWRKALHFGAGHGGVEAVILGVLVMLTYINMVVMRGMELSSLPLTADQLAALQRQLAEYWGAPWYASLLGALERVWALILHLSLAVLVLQVFVRRSWLWLAAAILWHALANAVAVYLVSMAGPYWTEAALGVIAALSLGIIFALRRPEPPAPSQPGPPAPDPQQAPVPLESAPLTDEALERTKYQ